MAPLVPRTTHRPARPAPRTRCERHDNGGTRRDSSLTPTRDALGGDGARWPDRAGRRRRQRSPVSAPTAPSATAGGSAIPVALWLAVGRRARTVRRIPAHPRRRWRWPSSRAARPCCPGVRQPSAQRLPVRSGLATRCEASFWQAVLCAFPSCRSPSIGAQQNAARRVDWLRQRSWRRQKSAANHRRGRWPLDLDVLNSNRERARRALSADGLGERDDDPLGAADVGHSPRALVLADSAHQRVAGGCRLVNGRHRGRERRRRCFAGRFRWPSRPVSPASS